jgi:tetratricopeptide (TPR) repeat protein/transcriptional regulator with XRE-family HTH domain
MRTFADLLSEYMTRTGVSDAELARAIGVQRQTIFRWKEGLVARPRLAEDVLRCAAKLRLTAEERDRLLLAAGFPPEAPAPLPASDLQIASIEASAQPPTSPEPAAADDLPDGRAIAPPEPGGMAPVAQDATLALRAVRYVAIIIAAVAILSVAAWLIWRSRDGRFPVAAPGETLVVVGQFANYTGGVQGYNVAGRLQTALKRELDAARLPSARAAVWPEVIPDEATAQAVSRRAAAALVIWGEYDSGRVVGRFTLPPAQPESGDRRYEKLLASPDELATVINADLPEEVRYLSLLTLAQLYAGKADHGRARAALVQALTRPPADRGALAALYFLLGYVQQSSEPADLGAAIEAYTSALAVQPALISAHSNRAAAYLRRAGPGDLERAAADLTAVIAVWPADAASYVNRGATYLRLKRPGDLERAAADLDRAVALAPTMVEAYFNRGLARIRANDAAGWLADLKQALILDPDHAGAYAALCWGYALDRQAAAGLPYCDRAVALVPSGPGRDSRGIVYAELGRFAEAMDDIEAYLRGDASPDERAERARWLADLAAGRDPFDQATLDRLRGE